MKIKITRSKFLEGLKIVQNVIDSNNKFTIIQNILLEAKDGNLNLTATNLDISIRTSVDCEVETAGAITLPKDYLIESIAKSIEGVIQFESDENNIAEILAGSAVFKLTGLPVADFPSLPVDGEEGIYKFRQMDLREMLRKTNYAASHDDTRKTLRGVYLSFKDGKATMVATDGRRLALIEHEIDFSVAYEKDVVLPLKLVSELLRSLNSDGDVEVKIGNSQISFAYGETKIYSKLVDEIYPNYRQVIPTGCDRHVVIERKLLLDALERVKVLSKSESRSTRLIFDSNQLSISLVAAQVGEARDIVPIKYNGDKIEIIFNPDFLIDPLKAIDEDEISIELNNGSSPALVKCSVPFLYVIMPLRIS